MNRKEKDELRILFSQKIEKIEPGIDPSSIRLIFHNVTDKDIKIFEDKYVIEIIVPPSYEKTLYFTGKNEAWVKIDGVKQKLRSTSLVDWIKKNII